MKWTEISTLLGMYRMPYNSEKELHRAMIQVFDAKGIEFEYEVRLGDHGIIDFLLPEIALGIEVKIKGGVKDIYKQCKRYCASGKISVLILYTAKAMDLPSEIEGIPCHVVSVGNGWL